MYALTPPLKNKKPIGLTALIDVVFILLLFFMLTTTFNRWALMPLNSTYGKKLTNDNARVNKIILREDNHFAILTNAVYKEDILFSNDTAILLENMNTEEETILIPYKETTIQSIIYFIEQLNTAGINNVNLVSSIEKI